MTSRLLFASAAILCAAPGALGQDLSPPSWRGGPLCTYERWDFSGGPNGGPPDVHPYLNPYGVPQLVPSPVDTWATSSGAGVPPRPFVWEIGAFSQLRTTVNGTAMPVATGPTTGCEQMVVSITFFGGEPEVTVDPIAGHGAFSVILDSEVFVPLADGWTFARYDYTLFAAVSPDLLNVTTTNADSESSWMDYQAIDTQVPGPGPGAAMAGWGLWLWRRRRSRSTR